MLLFRGRTKKKRGTLNSHWTDIWYTPSGGLCQSTYGGLGFSGDLTYRIETCRVKSSEKRHGYHMAYAWQPFFKPHITDSPGTVRNFLVLGGFLRWVTKMGGQSK